VIELGCVADRKTLADREYKTKASVNLKLGDRHTEKAVHTSRTIKDIDAMVEQVGQTLASVRTIGICDGFKAGLCSDAAYRQIAQWPPVRGCPRREWIRNSPGAGRENARS